MTKRGFFGVLYIFADWLFRLASANLLWIGFNLPLIFFALGLLIVEELGELLQIGVIVLVLLPFVFFPATTAMVSVVKGWIIDSADNDVFKPFLAAYRSFYRKSVLGGVFITLLWLLFIVDYIYFFDSLIVINYVLYFLFVILVVFTIYFFSSMLYLQEDKVRVILKETLIQTLRKPFLSFVIAVLSLIAIFISFNLLTFLIPLLLGSFIALISSLAYNYLVREDEL